MDTAGRIKEAALGLFAERGYAGTSVGAIEEAAGLVPRAGAFYRHFESKEALFEELALERVTETPDEFDFEGLGSFGDTRAELVALARQFELASERQRPYLRLIGELRSSGRGAEFESRANGAMLRALMGWVATKPAGCGCDEGRLAALAVNVFGAWLFYLTKQQQGVELAPLCRDGMLRAWADHWGGVLDSPAL